MGLQNLLNFKTANWKSWQNLIQVQTCRQTLFIQQLFHCELNILDIRVAGCGDF